MIIMNAIEIYRRTIRHFLGPIATLLADSSVTEILVNGPDNIYFEREGMLHLSDLRFPDAASLQAAIRNIGEFVGRTVDAENHSMDARLPDGSRVHVIIAPSARHGAHMSIRKFHERTFSLESLVQRGSLSEEAAEFLAISVTLHKNIIISGGTGTGKTSVLNALSGAIAEHERIIVIEDSAELRLRQPHTVYLETQPAGPDGRGRVTIRDLFVDSLRMRPDRIVVGEVRRGEALDMIQSMISGHAGALTTVHANTPRDALTRLETLCLMAGVDLPVYVARRQVASAAHVIVQLARLHDGSRVVQTIAEITGLDNENTYAVSDVFRVASSGRGDDGRLRTQLVATGYRPSYAAEPLAMGFGDHIRLTGKLFDTAPK